MGKRANGHRQGGVNQDLSRVAGFVLQFEILNHGLHIRVRV